MSEALDVILHTLDLTDTHARTSEDIFTATSHPMPGGRIFGGQVLGQAVIAAQRTIEGRIIHSMHGYFLRPGDTSKPITFSVDRIHDGRSFATRRSQAYQDGLPIFSMIASFQTEDDGLEHQVEMPTGIPEPEDLESAQRWPQETPWEVRYISSPVFSEVDDDRRAHQSLWIRTAGTMPDDPDLHRGLLAYLSDYSILEPILRRHGVAWRQPGLKIASLDHAMWFHRFGRVDEWMLYDTESPTATGGRGLSFGRFFSRDGTLIASVAQEGTIRVGPAAS
ncbi:MAG: acyl-CoA thioesterase [Microbacteriaceae bacterium]|jgi:acyl-CoA thioesterase-2|nr:acyl-CoA thioesterase [Microbacteriaceae bacterium]